MSHADIRNLNADGLLEISVASPEQLFVGDPQADRLLWRSLSNQWHPDRNSEPQARWVFSHIQDLYAAAKRKLDSGLWDAPDLLSLTTRGGKRYRLRHCNKHSIDIGLAYIGRNVMAYLLEADFDDLAVNAQTRISHFPFVDARMEKEMRRCLPMLREQLQTQTARVLILEKDPDFVSLRHLLKYSGGTLSPEHVAWITSALLNICCYLQTVGLAHQAIAIDHCLVSMRNHIVQLCGGWWYSAAQDSTLLALPERSARVAPPELLRSKVADGRLDLFLVRETALELLGEQRRAAPAAMLDFLMLAPAHSAIVDYEHWQRALWESFGERRFVPFALTEDDIYTMPS